MGTTEDFGGNRPYEPRGYGGDSRGGGGRYDDRPRNDYGGGRDRYESREPYNAIPMRGGDSGGRRDEGRRDDRGGGRDERRSYDDRGGRDRRYEEPRRDDRSRGYGGGY